MRIFKNKLFNRWGRGEGLTADDLRGVVKEMAAGDTGASLGGKVFKKRIALSGREKEAGLASSLVLSWVGMYFLFMALLKTSERISATMS